MAIELLIAEEQELVRAGLARLLENSEVRVVAEAENGTMATRLALKLRPRLVLIDIHLPDKDGFDCLTRLRKELPEAAVLMFGPRDNPTHLARAIALGSIGFISTSVKRAELLAAVRAAAAGEALWSRDELRRTSGALVARRGDADSKLWLTPRENEVLKQLTFGLSNKEIAQALGISYETVKEHVQHILRKLGVADRTQAAVWAVRNEKA
jgi:DNA-binding NarL/FixJ family response regulator